MAKSLELLEKKMIESEEVDYQERSGRIAKTEG